VVNTTGELKLCNSFYDKRNLDIEYEAKTVNLALLTWFSLENGFLRALALGRVQAILGNLYIPSKYFMIQG